MRPEAIAVEGLFLFVMARLDPRPSGLIVVPLERQLKRVEIGRRLDSQQAIDAPAMHEIGADQSGDEERAFGGVLCAVGETKQPAERGSARRRSACEKL